MIINHNIPAIGASRYFKINTNKLNDNIRQLSSGLRINKAADDSSGLAVSEKMRAHIRGLNQASRNAQDGISFLQTAEGWLAETTEIIQRLRELSVQSANGIYTDEDRLQIRIEVEQLVDEVDRIASQAEFNSLRLLRGGFARGGGGEKAPALEGATVSNAMPPVIAVEPDSPTPHELVNKDSGGIFIHVGASKDQREKVYVEDMSPQALGITKIPVMILTQEGANESIEKLDSALYAVSKQRADLGGFQSRLENTIRGVDTAADNLQMAESQVRDLDMAKGMVEFVKNQILAQATGTMLAQANLRPQLILRVLG